jgi:hypothetical protein
MYKLLANNIPNSSVFIFDSDMRFIMAAGEELVKNGYDPEKMIGLTLQETLSYERYLFLKPYYQRTLNGEYTQFESSSGHYTYLNTFIPMRSKTTGRYFGVAISQNITAQRQTQTQLAEQQELFKAVFDQTFQLMLLLSPDGKLTNTNQTALNFGGVSIENMRGVNLWDTVWWNTTSAEQKEVLKIAVKEAAQGKLVRYEIEFVSGSGELITLDFSIKPLLNAEGEVKLLIAEGRNISEIKKAKEEALETSRILLLQNKKLEEFAHITSHNLRAPIGNMMMLSNWLDNATDTTEFDFLVKSLKESAQKTLNTIDVLAQTLRIHNEKKDAHETIFFEQIIEDVKQILSASIIEASAEIIQDFAACPQIQYSAIYMESILQNLLSNALKYRSLERKCQIKIQTRWEQNRMVLIFSDNGIGIDLTHNQDRIFGLYKTFHDNADARGVGLFLVKNQVEALGGSIAVESTPNVGTTFCIIF